MKSHRFITLLATAVLILGASAGSAEGETDMIAVGEDFVEFELPAHDGSTVNSGDLAGNPYLLFFYPKADTGGWTLEANQLRDSWDDLQALGIHVIGVSYDSQEKNRDFAEKNSLPFLLLSDLDHELAKSVGASRALLPLPKRVSYLVGPDGTVLANYPDVDPKTHAAEVLAEYRALLVPGV